MKNNRFNKLKIKRILRDYTQNSSITKINWFWLSGFIQGDGCFIIRRTRDEYILYVSQSLLDVQVLFKIKSFLGYGYVRIQEKDKMAHFVLQNQKGLIYVLSHLGPFFDSKNESFLLFLEKYNIVFFNNNLNILSTDFVNLNNAWLSGFIDADGSFYGSFTKNKHMISGYNLQLRFSITQKSLSVLIIFSKLFNSKVKYNKKGFHYVILSDKESLDLLLNYLTNFPLFTKKAISLKRWSKLYILFKTKEHLNQDSLYLKKLVESINKF